MAKELAVNERNSKRRHEQRFMDQLKRNLDELNLTIRRNVPADGNSFSCHSDDNVSFQGVAKKSVFCVNHLEPATSTETVSLFVTNNGISVTSFSKTLRLLSQPREC